MSRDTDIAADVAYAPPTQTEKWKKVIKRAKKRFNRTANWESIARSRSLDDLRFAEGDSYNGYQWPNDIRSGRDIKQKPSLTINQARQHNLQIINDIRKNKPAIKFRPVGNGASAASARIFDALAKHVEYQSDADSVYGHAGQFQVKCGIGYFRITTDWAHEESWEQEIYIRKILDPRGVYIDPDAKMDDKSDMRFAFIFEDVSKEVFNKLYPEFKDHAPISPLTISEGWITPEHIRICEYYEVVSDTDKLHSFIDSNSGETRSVLESKMTKRLARLSTDDPNTKVRTIKTTKVMYYFIVGDLVVEEQEWIGRYIPIVPMIGEETIIDGQLDRKGHTRAMLDAQRMYNYYASSAVEFGALQGKTPWIAPAQAIEGYEVMWNNANMEDFSVMTWNHKDDDGEPIPKPERAQPPVQAPLYLQGMQLAQDQMMQTSGQHKAEMGEQDNSRTGLAIQERQKQADTATYHFIDNQTKAIRFCGRILLDLFPKIYDSKRVITILDEEGKDFELTIDPEAAKAYHEELAEDGSVIKRVLNPTVGLYTVRADAGPSFSTQREEAWNMLGQILTQAPTLTSIIGDLLLRNGDFPLAEEAADRLRRMVPKMALGEGPTPEEAQLQAQLQHTQGLLQKSFLELTDAQLKIKGKDEMRDIDAYDAETKRIAAMQKLMPLGSPEEIAALIHQLVADALSTQLSPLIQTNSQAIGASPQATSLGLNSPANGSPNAPAQSPSPSQALPQNGQTAGPGNGGGNV